MIFNIRVYGVLLNTEKQVLVSDEYIRGNYYTKFPGGGLEIGEGTRDCLKREFKEEMNLEVEIGEHLYTTDFYQVSAFNPNQQIISIYYWVEALETIRVRLSTKKNDFNDEKLEIYNQTSQIETFRFIPLENFSPDEVSLPIDKVVAKMITEKRK